MLRFLLLLGVVVITGCTLPFTSSHVLTAREISAKPYASDLKNASLIYVGSYDNNGTYTNIEGKGYVFFKPEAKSSISYTITPSMGPSQKITEININSSRYLQVNGGKWNKQASTKSILDNIVIAGGDPNTTLKGSNQLKSGLAWHLSTIDSTNSPTSSSSPAVVETWVRQKDGYLVQIRETVSNVVVIITLSDFNSPNNSVSVPPITAP